MNLTPSNMEALKKLVEQDPALLEDLGRSSSRQEFTKKLTTAAQAKDLVIDETELGKVMDAAFDQYAENAELSDEQLENVTGGVVGVMIVGTAASILGAVVGAGFAVGLVYGSVKLAYAIKPDA